MGQPHSWSVMNTSHQDSTSDLKPGEVRLDRLLGRQVWGPNNQPVGRLQEFRAERRGNGILITEYVIGVAGLLERLGLGVKLLFGKNGGGYTARWDQLDISDPMRPRLMCPVSELRKAG
jgi:hypothetical protein